MDLVKTPSLQKLPVLDVASQCLKIATNGQQSQILVHRGLMELLHEVWN